MEFCTNKEKLREIILELGKTEYLPPYAYSLFDFSIEEILQLHKINIELAVSCRKDYTRILVEKSLTDGKLQVPQLDSFLVNCDSNNVDQIYAVIEDALSGKMKRFNLPILGLRSGDFSEATGQALLKFIKTMPDSERVLVLNYLKTKMVSVELPIKKPKLNKVYIELLKTTEIKRELFDELILSYIDNTIYVQNQKIFADKEILNELKNIKSINPLYSKLIDELISCKITYETLKELAQSLKVVDGKKHATENRHQNISFFYLYYSNIEKSIFNEVLEMDNNYTFSNTLKIVTRIKPIRKRKLDTDVMNVLLSSGSISGFFASYMNGKEFKKYFKSVNKLESIHHNVRRNFPEHYQMVNSTLYFLKLNKRGNNLTDLKDDLKRYRGRIIDKNYQSDGIRALKAKVPHFPAAFRFYHYIGKKTISTILIHSKKNIKNELDKSFDYLNKNYPEIIQKIVSVSQKEYPIHWLLKTFTSDKISSDLLAEFEKQCDPKIKEIVRLHKNYKNSAQRIMDFF